MVSRKIRPPTHILLAVVAAFLFAFGAVAEGTVQQYTLAAAGGLTAVIAVLDSFTGSKTDDEPKT